MRHRSTGSLQSLSSQEVHRSRDGPQQWGLIELSLFRVTLKHWFSFVFVLDFNPGRHSNLYKHSLGQALKRNQAVDAVRSIPDDCSSTSDSEPSSESISIFTLSDAESDVSDEADFSSLISKVLKAYASFERRALASKVRVLEWIVSIILSTEQFWQNFSNNSFRLTWLNKLPQQMTPHSRWRISKKSASLVPIWLENVRRFNSLKQTLKADYWLSYHCLSWWRKRDFRAFHASSHRFIALCSAHLRYDTTETAQLLRL